MPTSTLYPPLAKKGLCNRRGKPPDTAGAAGQGARFELIVGDGGAFDGAPNEVAVQPVGQVAAIEPIGPLPQVAREVLGADTVMGADEPGFDVAEQCMDDWEERASVGAFVLDHGGVPEVFAEGGIAAAIAGEPVGQEVRLGLDIRLEEGAEFGAGGGRQHGDPRLPAKNPCWRLTACPCFLFLFFGAGTFSTAATTRLLSGLAVLRPRLVRSPRPPMKVSSASRKPRSRRVGSSLSP